MTKTTPASWPRRILILALSLAVAACAHRAAREPAPSPSISPVVRGADRGLELWWWVVTDPRPVKEFGPGEPTKPGDPPPHRTYSVADPGQPLEQVLARYLDRPTPFSKETIALWKRHGIRVVCVPLEKLDSVQASLRLTGPVHRQWFGEIAQWTDVIRGPEFSAPKLLMVGENAEELRPGRMQLMARCWVYPADTGSAGPGAALRLELVPKYEPALSERSRLQISAALSDNGQDPDFYYRSLLAAGSVEGRAEGPVQPSADITPTRSVDAILLVPDSPDADWTRPPEAIDEEAGPGPDLPPTLGEVMLSVPPARSPSGVTPRSRAVVILIPRLPERFELLGP